MSPRSAEVYGQVSATAPGRINLTAHVGQPISDSYHQISVLSMAISLRDEVTAVARNDGYVTVTVSESSTGILNPEDIPDDNSNVVFQAAELLRARMGVDPQTHGVDLYLTKNLPLAGGVGGRAADAAAALMACAALWDLKLSRAQLASIGSEISTQVPFAILGGLAVGTEDGSELTPLISRARFHLVLVPAYSGFHPAEVYETLHTLRTENVVEDREYGRVPKEMLSALMAGDHEQVGLHMTNDLQIAAVSLLPELSEVLDIGMQEGALTGMVCGAGPSLMFLASDPEEAMNLASRIEDRTGISSIPISGPAPGARIH